LFVEQEIWTKASNRNNFWLFIQKNIPFRSLLPICRGFLMEQ